MLPSSLPVTPCNVSTYRHVLAPVQIILLLASAGIFLVLGCCVTKRVVATKKRKVGPEALRDDGRASVYTDAATDDVSA